MIYISIYLESIKFLISGWIKLARNAFEVMAIVKITKIKHLILMAIQ